MTRSLQETEDEMLSVIQLSLVDTDYSSENILFSTNKAAPLIECDIISQCECCRNTTRGSIKHVTVLRYNYLENAFM